MARKLITVVAVTQGVVQDLDCKHRFGHLLEADTNFLIERRHHDVILTPNLRAHGVRYHFQGLVCLKPINDVLNRWYEILIERVKAYVYGYAHFLKPHVERDADLARIALPDV